MTKIKLPIVKKGINADSLWKTIVSISETGSTFNTNQLLSAPSAPTKSSDILGRILSYLKFLGVLSESRRGDEQQFTVIHSEKVDNLIYSLKAKRSETAFKIWLEIILEHPMFQYVIEKFFTRSNSRTFIDLEHFLKGEIPNKEPGYYQDGGKFIISFLQSSGIVEVSGNNIHKVETKEDENDYSNSQPLEAGETQESDSDEEALNGKALISTSNSFKIKEEYFISIKTPNIKFESKLENSLQLGVVETILQTIKIELGSYNE